MNTFSTLRSSRKFFRTFFLAVIAFIVYSATASAIEITVDIGRKSRDCRGFGVCSITIGVGNDQNAVTANGQLNGDSLTITFAQPVRGAEKALVIDEPIDLDGKTVRGLGASRVRVVPGSYAVDYSSNPNGSVTVPVQRIGITIHIEAGRKSKDCTGFGICSIDISTERLRSPVPTIATVDGDVLNLEFAKRLPDRGDTLIIDEDIPLDPATARGLGMKEGVVKRGSYAVDYNSNPNGSVSLQIGSTDITINVRIGRKSSGCRGFGICAIWVGADANAEAAQATGTVKGNRMRIDFRTTLNEREDVLVIDEPVELDEESSLAFGGRKVVILPGAYKMDYSSNPNGSVDVKIQSIGVTIGVDIGRRSKDCRGLGICSIWIDFDLRQGTIPTVASLEDSTLTLLFTRELPEQGDTFTVEEDVELDPQIARMLGAKGVTIRKGAYVIRRDAKGRPYVELPAAKIGVTVTIYIGRGSECTRFGICRISVDVDFTLRSVQGVATVEGDMMELEFLNESPENDDLLILDHGVALDERSAAKLGVDEILPGEYMLSYSDNKYGTARLRTERHSATVAPDMTDAAAKARAFPNPTDGAVTLHFNVRRNGPVTITLANARGEVIGLIAQKTMEAGEQSVSFDAGALTDGIYFYTIRSAEGTESGRMVVAH